MWWHTVTHGRGIEGETGEWSGYPVPFTLPRNVVYPALLPLMHTPRLPVVDWTDVPADLNGLVRFVQRRNLISARVPSHVNWPLLKTWGKHSSKSDVEINWRSARETYHCCHKRKSHGGVQNVDIRTRFTHTKCCTCNFALVCDMPACISGLGWPQQPCTWHVCHPTSQHCIYLCQLLCAFSASQDKVMSLCNFNALVL